MPTIGDVDGDGNNDLVLGDASGMLSCFINKNDSLVLLSNEWGGIKLGDSPTMPHIGFFDDNERLDLLVFNRRGEVVFCLNFKGTAFEETQGVFYNDSLEKFSNKIQGRMLAPTMADLNNDGLGEVVLGSYRGGLFFYKGAMRNPNGLKEIRSPKRVAIYPNPANQQVIVEHEGELTQYSIYDLSGRLVKDGNLENDKTIICESLVNGVYVIMLQGVNNISYKEKLIIQR